MSSDFISTMSSDFSTSTYRYILRNVHNRNNFESILLTKKLLCGAIAGATGCFIGQPLDLIKIRLQTEPELYTSAYSCFVKTFQEGGYRGFYRGMAAPLYSQFFQSGLMFTGESVALKYLEPASNLDQKNPKAVNIFLAGSFGGLLKCLLLVPADVIKCKMQVDHSSNKKSLYNGSLDCFFKIYNTQGIRGLYAGFGVTTMREVPAIGIYFFVYRYSLKMLGFFCARPSSGANQDQDQDQNQKSVEKVLYTSNSLAHITPSKRPGLEFAIAGGLAGTVSWICIYPFDVIKSNIQVAYSNGKNSMTIYETIVNLYRQQGLRVFTRGLSVTVARAFPVNAALFYTHEYLSYICGIYDESVLHS
jgi:hypothetical protein